MEKDFDRLLLALFAVPTYLHRQQHAPVVVIALSHGLRSLPADRPDRAAHVPCQLCGDQNAIRRHQRVHGEGRPGSARMI